MKNSRNYRFFKWLIKTIVLIGLIFLVFTFVFDRINGLLSLRYEGSYVTDFDFFNYGEMVAALIGAFLVVIQLRRDAEVERDENLIHQSQFITDYNNYF